MMSSQAKISMENLDGFFLEKFEIKFQSSHKTDWLHSRVFLLGEDHTDLIFRRNYSSLIDAVSKTHNVVVLVEGETSMSEINKRASTQTCFISSNVTIYGWDDSTPKERYPDLPQIDECTKLYLKYEHKLLEAEAEADPRVSEKLNREADEILNNFYTIEQQLDQNVYKETVRENFPKRTKSMINTIKHVIALHPESMIFVIAGRNHVHQEIQDDPRLNLESLYQYLETIESMSLVTPPELEECAIM